MKKIFTLQFLLLIAVCSLAQVKAIHLKTENLTDPIGIDAINPRFSWQLDGEGRRGVAQTAYQVEVMDGKHQVWNSNKVTSDQSVYVDYKGEKLQSGKKYSWQVKVWDETGKPSELN